MSDVRPTLQAIRDRLIVERGGLKISRAAFSDMSDVAHFLEFAIPADSFVMQSRQGVKLIDTQEAALALSGKSALLGFAEFNLNLIFKTIDGQLDITLEGHPDGPLTLPAIDWITLEEPRLIIHREGKYGTATLAFFAELPVGSGSPLHVALQPGSSGEWLLLVAGTKEQFVPLDDVTHVDKFLGSETLASFLPPSLIAKVSSVAITGISATFNPGTGTLSYFSLGLAYLSSQAGRDVDRSGEWPITSKLTVRNLTFSLTLINPIGPHASARHSTAAPDDFDFFDGLDLPLNLPEPEKRIIGTVTGQVVIGGQSLQIFVQGQGGSSTQWSAGLLPNEDGRAITLPNLADILELADRKDLLDTLPGGFKDIPRIVIHRLRVDFNPAKQSLDSLSLHVTTDGGWKVIAGMFELQHLDIRLELANLISDSALRIEGIVFGIFQIGDLDIDFNISAVLSNAPDRGWQFEGRADLSRQTPQIRALVDQLDTHFQLSNAHIPLPTALETLKIEDITITYNTQGNALQFTCDGTLKLDATTDLRSSITIKLEHHKKDGSFSRSFAGTITIGQSDFKLLFQSEKAAEGPASNVFIAKYKSDTPSTMRDLIRPLTEKGAEYVPQIGIKQAFIVYKSGMQFRSDRADTGVPQKSQGAYLLGLEIDGALDLSQQQLPSLPLVGQPFPSDQPLQLTFRLLYASQKFEANDLLGLPAIGDSQLAAGLTLATTLQMENKPHQINLPISIPSHPQATGEDGLHPAPVEAKTSAPITSDSTQWLTLQKSFGPLRLERLGFRYQDSQVTALLDGGVRLAGFELMLIGAGLTFPLKRPQDITIDEIAFSLQGLAVAMQPGAVSVSGGLYKQENEYVGALRVDFQAFSISAIGILGTLPGSDESTLFIYGALTAGEGAGFGNAIVKITGLALGIGINRRVIAPSIEQVTKFSMVRMAMGEIDDGQQSGGDFTILEEMRDELAPAPGVYFGCIGLRFTLLETLDCFALAIVQFGDEVEFTILGLARMKLPRTPAGQKQRLAICYVELALKATLKPAEGSLKVEALITSNSWVLRDSCKLTGGFALYIWFAGEHKGDFVVTLGGYHPRFRPPAHYPAVPRLGFNWPVTPQLLIKGEMYCAITPSAIMAGGRLEATFRRGSVAAWFIAYADMLVAWAPVHYEIDMGISLHVEVDLGIFPISVTLGVDLHLWGPPFGGVANVMLSVTSFDVYFGSSRTDALPEPIRDWSEFGRTFLDSAGDEAPADDTTRGSNADIWASPNNRQPLAGPALHHFNLDAGRVERSALGDDEKTTVSQANGVWLVRGDELTISVTTVIPASELYVVTLSDEGLQSLPVAGVTHHARPLTLTAPLDHATAEPMAISQHKLGIRPMGITTVETPLKLAIVREGNREGNPVFHSVDISDWRCREDRSGMPGALWKNSSHDPKTPKSEIIDGCIGGVASFRPPQGHLSEWPVGEVHSADLNWHEEAEKETARPASAQPAPVPAAGRPEPQMVASRARRARSAITQALAAAGFSEWADYQESDETTMRPLDAVPLYASMGDL